MAYKYITDNNLYEKQTYMYSEYKGLAFIKEYLNSRQEFLSSQEPSVGTAILQLEVENNPVQKELRIIQKRLESGNDSKEVIDSINAYTKSFEVRKRIYTGYDSNWKPLEGAGFEEYESYLLFADCLILAYRSLNNLKYYSCLLKVNDTLLSVRRKLDSKSREYLSRVISQELDIFLQLANEKGISMEVVE